MSQTITPPLKSFPYNGTWVILQDIFFWSILCEIVSLSFNYLRYSLIGFNKKINSKLSGQEVEGSSWEGEMNPRKEEEAFYQETQEETDLTTGLEGIVSPMFGWD